jgi:hypothetical protein
LALSASRNFITIGTGGVTGVYYSVGGAICLLVNKERLTHGIRCSAEGTGGSVYNLNALRAGEIDLAMSQSDWQYHAFKGTSKFESDGAYRDLRAVFSLYPEPFTVVARADSGINAFRDLQGKRVNIGNPGSGQRATMEVVMKAFGWTNATFSAAAELKSAEQSAALCSGMIDAMVFTVGHPSASIKDATTACDSAIVGVEGPVIDKLVKDNDYYRYAVIQGGMYRGNPNTVTTFGVAATMVASARTPAEVVYSVVKAVFENFEAFKALHPAFKSLTKKEMMGMNLSTPLHEGAIRYYKEAGLM